RCLSCLLLAFAFAALPAQRTLSLHLHAPSLPDTARVYVAGNAGALGNWDPAKVMLQAQGHHNWMLTLDLPDNAPVEYKYTLGSWEREGLDALGKVRPNFRITDPTQGAAHDTIPQWLDGQRPAPSGQITGTVRYHLGLQPVGLARRDVVVWLPPGYAANPKARYPVLYMHDGQNVVDPKTSSFGVDWQVDEACDTLIRSGKIPPMIVVGVYNSGDRRDEYSPGEKGAAYADFLIQQLKPLIDKTYRTQPDRKHTYVGGSSMGGLISFMLVWEHSEVFSKAICMSPAFQFPGFDYLPAVTQAPGKRHKVAFYIDNGGQGLEITLQPGVDAMRKALADKGYREGKDSFWVIDPDAEHFEAAWARRMPNALVLLLGK
ncbi:MAG TPA: alpha/beta hydrolase-fold protein, partial [Bacteroidia bacterium]|nr:alpha/beta hydrolase-fold protein [Bacteroidia bacterium]